MDMRDRSTLALYNLVMWARQPADPATLGVRRLRAEHASAELLRRVNDGDEHAEMYLDDLTSPPEPDCDHLGPYTVTACGEDNDHGYWEETRCNACGYRSTETGMDKPALPW